MWRWTGVVLVSLALTACMMPQPTSAVRNQAAEPLVCEGEQQCAVYWQRAYDWMVLNTVWKVEDVTDNTMRTVMPMDGSDERGFEVRRVPAGEGREELVLRTHCDGYAWVCNTSDTAAIASFKQYVRAVD